MLGTLHYEEKTDWKAHVSTLVHTYNATHHESIGHTPFYLMFGRHPRLAIDAFLGLGENKKALQTDYAKRLRERLAFAYKTGSIEAAKSSERYKRNYDVRVQESKLEPGDKVLVRLVGLRGKYKLSDKWEYDPYVVLSQLHLEFLSIRFGRKRQREESERCTEICYYHSLVYLFLYKK